MTETYLQDKLVKILILAWAGLCHDDPNKLQPKTPIAGLAMLSAKVVWSQATEWPYTTNPPVLWHWR